MVYDKTDEISVGLNFVLTVVTMVYDFNTDYDCDADWRYNFYADGTKSSPEQFSRCLELMNKYEEVPRKITKSYD